VVSSPTMAPVAAMSSASSSTVERDPISFFNFSSGFLL
jgi:hypothetical protein